MTVSAQVTDTPAWIERMPESPVTVTGVSLSILVPLPS